MALIWRPRTDFLGTRDLHRDDTLDVIGFIIVASDGFNADLVAQDIPSTLWSILGSARSALFKILMTGFSPRKCRDAWGFPLL